MNRSPFKSPLQGSRGPSPGCPARPILWSPAVKAPPSEFPPPEGLSRSPVGCPCGPPDIGR
eukprot:5469218-Pyramimonas_sp.AAC.1